MRVYIREKGKKGISLPIPLWVVRIGLNNMVKKIVLKYTPEDQRKYIESVDFKSLAKCFKDLKKHRGLTLVEVREKDGDEVIIVV